MSANPEEGEPGPENDERQLRPMLGTDVERWGLKLRYSVDPERLGEELSSRFVPSTLDTEGEAFVASALERVHRRSTWQVHRLLTLFLSDFDVNGLLGTYPVFLLSTPQALELLAAGSERPPARQHLLDVGAGSGDVTTRLSPLVERVTCVESSRFMCRVLRRRGFDTWRGEAGRGLRGDPLSSAERHDVISLFNVVDRCRTPRRLLRASVDHLCPGGVLLLSSPLPFRPFFYSGSVTREPEERLDVASQHFEEAARELWENELRPLGLELSAVSRMPYLSRGDRDNAAYLLDAVVLSLRKTA